MKKYLSIVALSLICGASASADEGMWLPSLISQRIGDMQAKGFTLTAEDIYSINQASLKDAVVLFGGGCTGELISPEGLLLTNHHCGYGQIQRHSSVEHDYLRDGFWAMTRAEELPNPGLSVSFLEYMEDVTDQVLEGYDESMTEQEREALVDKNSAKLVEEATAAGNGLRASVEPLFYGNKYYMFVYRRYTDVRLVGAPPRLSESSAVTPTTGCGPAIPETSPSSASTPTRTTTPLPIPRTMCPTDPRSIST